MSYLTDIEHVRLIGGLTTSTTKLPDAKFRTSLATAAARMKGSGWVGASNYATALAEITTGRAALSEGENLEDDGDLSEMARALRDAEAFLAMSFMVQVLNMNYDGAGITVSVVTEKGQINNLSPQGVKTIARSYKKEAATSAWVYLQSKVVSGGKTPAYDDAGNEI